MTSVVFAMEWVPQYRVPFYAGVREHLGDRGIEVRLLHGEPPASRRKRRDDGSLPWAEPVANRFLTVSGLELTWQPVLRRLGGSDLLILQQETGLLLNYPSLLRSRVGGPPVALWGHGHNFNPLEANVQAEWVKARITRFADWVFAYTERSAEVFRSIGVPPDRITVVQNSMDIASLVNPTGSVSSDVADVLDGMRNRGARVGWIVSALDRWKRVDQLIEIIDGVRERIPSFEFVAIGAGDDVELLDTAAVSRPWLHVMGPRFGADKAALGRMAELTIHPGLAGLHVVEAFATATPMVTADLAYHSHETDYLESGTNSLVLQESASADDLAAAVATLFADDEQLLALQDGCRRSAETYTLDAMIERFADGVEAAIARTS